MNTEALFSMALGLQAHWQVKEVTFSTDDKLRSELHLHIDFASGLRFPDEANEFGPIHVRVHWSGIVHFVTSHITNGILEGINCKIQLAKRRARGYRNINNFINMIYYLCGKLKFDYPLYFT